MTEDKIVRKLRLQLEAALAKQKDDQAITILIELVKVDPKATRWPHKLGDLYRKRGRKAEAIEQYSNAADLYQDQGFLARAIAIAKAVIDLDPRRFDVLERIDPDSARKLNSAQRPPAISMRPGHSAVIAEDTATSVRAPSSPRNQTRNPGLAPDDDRMNWHPSVIPEGPSSTRHPAVILEDDEPVDAHAPLPRHRAIIPEDPPVPSAHHAVLPDGPTEGSVATRAPRRTKTLDGSVPLQIPKPPTPPPTPVKAPSSTNVPTAMLAMAPELTRAPDAEEGEVRFSDAPPATAVKLDLSELEVAPRSPVRSSLLPEPGPFAPDKLATLPLFPLFAEVAQPALRDLITSAEALELDDGALVFSRGDNADALYGIVEGSVELLFQKQGAGAGVTLAEGDVFGESCLLTGEKRHADVVVRGRLVALKFPRAKLAQLAAGHPRLTELLLELLTRRLMANLVQTSPLFLEIDAQGRQDLIAQFEIRRAARGTMLAELGKVSDGLYISLTGALEVGFADGRPPERHEPGTLFGQASLLTRSPSEVSVRALSHMLVLRLPLRGFQTIAMQYPSMLAHLSSLADSSVAQISA